MTASIPRPEFREIPIGLIVEPALPSRSSMDEQRMELLVTSMRTIGFISAIAVFLRGDVYEVIAGHRRRIAAGLAGLAAIPCLVYPSAGDYAIAIQYAENEEREPLNIADEAIWLAQLLDAHPDEGTDGVAARIKRTRNYVEGRLALLQGDEKVFAALAAGEIAIGVAQQLNRCTEDAHRRMLLDMAVRGGATVGLVSQWITEWKTIHAPATPNPIAARPAGDGGPVLTDEYFRCRVCGERDNTAHMQPVNVHDYCLRALIDPATGFFRSKADYVEFPRTREAALTLLQRVVDRFPELAA